MKRWVKILITVVAILVVVFGGFTLWAYNPLGPMAEGIRALESGGKVVVAMDDWLSFVPSGVEADTGLIIYPGARVDYRSYAPLARAIAEEGYYVAIVPMPYNLALFGVDRASEVMAMHPEITYWAIGGHSLGGAMAASYVYKHPGEMDGLVLWASYPAKSNDLSAQDIQVVSIYATLDGLSTGEKIDASRALLPADTTWVEIAGGDHAQFGWYGEQSGDNPATISREEQQAQIVDATVSFLAGLKR